MANEPLAFDFQNIWQSQTTEELVVSQEEIEERARRTDLKIHRGTWIFAAAVVLHTLAHILRAWVGQVEFVGWIGIVEFVTFTVILLYWPYQHAYKAKWPLSVVPKSGLTPGLDFYRRQLELRRNFIVDRVGLPAAIAIVAAFLIHAVRYPSIMVPVGIPFVILGAWLYTRWKRQLPMIQRELDDLKTFMQEGAMGAGPSGPQKNL